MTTRKRYRQFFYTMLIMGSALCIATVLLVVRVLPTVFTQVQPAVQNFAAACGCGQYVTSQVISWPLFLVGVATLGLIGLCIVALVRGLIIWIKTIRFEQSLQRTIIRQTQCKGKSIYRVQLHEPLAVCIGFWNPRIYVSTGLEKLLSGYEVWAVLRHELDHAIHRDPLQRLILRMIQPLFPMLRNAFQHGEALSEIAADEAICDDTYLQQALVKMFNYQQTSQRLAVTFFSSAESRINRLLGQPTRPIGKVRLVLVAIGISLGFGFAFQATAQREHSTEELSSCLAEQPMCREIMSVPVPLEIQTVNSTQYYYMYSAYDYDF